MLNQPFSFKNQTLSRFIACFCITHYGLSSVNVLILLFLIFVTSASHPTPVLKGAIEIQFSNISIPAGSKLFSTTWRNVGYTLRHWHLLCPCCVKREVITGTKASLYFRKNPSTENVNIKCTTLSRFLSILVDVLNWTFLKKFSFK